MVESVESGEAKPSLSNSEIIKNKMAELKANGSTLAPETIAAARYSAANPPEYSGSASPILPRSARAGAEAAPSSYAQPERTQYQSSNRRVGDAVDTLNAVGHTRAARELAEGAKTGPVGGMTTISNLVTSNPRAATGLLNSVAPEMQSREMNSMFRMGGMASMMQMLPMFIAMITGMGGNMMGNLQQSQAVAVMSNSPNSVMSANLRTAAGVSNDVKVASIAPDSGSTQTLGAQQPSAIQQNRLQAVPGANGPSMTPRGMG